MNEGRISTRYAKALLLTVEGDQEVGAVLYRQVEAALPALEGAAAELRAIIDDVLIEPVRKEAIIGGLFRECAPKLEPFACFMMRKGRGSYLLHTLRVFLRLYRLRHGIVRADIRCAVELNGERIDHLKEYLTAIYGSNLEVLTSVDTSLIGGFQLQVGDSLLDRSVRGELADIAVGLER